MSCESDFNTDFKTAEIKVAKHNEFCSLSVKSDDPQQNYINLSETSMQE